MLDDKEKQDQNEENQSRPEEDEVEDILKQLSEKDEPAPVKKEEPPSPQQTPPPDEEVTAGDTEDFGNLLREKPEEAPGKPAAEEPTAETVEEIGLLQRIFGVFLQPEKVFNYLKVKPDIWTPIILAALIGIASSFLVYDIAIQDTIAKFEQNENIPDEQRDMIIDSIEQRSSGAWRYVSIFVFPVIGTLVIFALVAGVYLLIGNVILGGKTGFKQMLSVFGYSYLILAIGSLVVKIPLMIAKGTIKVHTSLAAFLSPDSSETALFRFLDSFDIFTIWMLIVFGIGLATLYRFSRQKAMMGVFVPWLLYVLIFGVALGSFFSQFTGG